MQETFVCADEFGSDLEHVEVLQRKFDEFQKDMAAQEYRVTEVNQLAERLVLEGHPERETIVKRKDVSYCVIFVVIYVNSNIKYNMCILVFKDSYVCNKMCACDCVDIDLNF